MFFELLLVQDSGADIAFELFDKRRFEIRIYRKRSRHLFADIAEFNLVVFSFRRIGDTLRIVGAAQLHMLLQLDTLCAGFSPGFRRKSRHARVAKVHRTMMLRHLRSAEAAKVCDGRIVPNSAAFGEK